MSTDKRYSYTALDPATQGRKTGTMEAASTTEVSRILKESGLYPITVEEYRQTLANFELTPGADNKPAKLAADQVVAIARMMYLLIRSGIAMPKALRILAEDAPPAIEKMCSDLADKVLAGQSLSKAMEAYPKAFDEVFRSYVAAGESTGNMEDALFRLARMLDKGYQLRLKIKAVTAYPKMVSYAILVMVWGIMTFLVPRFDKIYSDLGQQLPAPTRLLVKVSELMSPINISLGIPPDLMPDGHTLLTAPLNFLSPILWLLIGFFAFKRWKRNNAEDLDKMTKLDKLKFRTPILGKLAKYNTMYRWSATMAGAMAAGLQTYQALDLAGRTAGSAWIKQVTIGLQDAIRSGRMLSTELAKHPDLFNAQIRAMAATGEESGDAAEVFENVARTLEDEIEAMVATLGAKIEVALLLIMGVVVGTLLVVLYLPILNLTNAASKGFSGE